MYDSSVLLNLLAADCLRELAETGEWEFAICAAVHAESKKLRDPETLEMVAVDTQPLIDDGILQLMDVEGAKEESLYLEQAKIVDDGEAMAIAIAAQRRFELAIDDKRASNHTKRTFPEISLWTTPEILKNWSESESVNETRLAKIVELIRVRARYHPPKSHPLYEWWMDLFAQ
ncbi:MAG: hypothetical protein AAF357_00995 [Verrucomicrobiota bacterium]